MKKFISSTLVIVMLITCMLSGITVSAETEVTFGKSDAVAICTFLADNMLNVGGADRRTEISRILSPYFETDMGIDTLVKILNEEIDIPADVQQILDQTTDLETVKTSIIFALKVIKCTDPAKRLEAIENFYLDAEGEVELTADEETAVANFYDMLVSSNSTAQDALLTPHSVTAASLLNLLTPFTGCFMFTDDEVGGDYIALKANSTSNDFISKFNENLADYTINGADVINATEFLSVAADTVNEELTTDEIADLKLVLGAVDLYEEKEESSGGGRRGGSSSSVKTPEPSAEPTEEPTDEPTEEPTYVPEANVIPAPEAADEADVFDDTAEHWGKDYIAQLTKREIFKGYEDGTFKPDLGITREEMAAVIIRVIDKEHELGTAPETTFADNDAIAEWAKDSVNLAVEKGIFTGYDDNEFKPKRIISREEIVAILMRSVEGNVMLEELSYTDLDEIGEWSINYVNRATAKGIVSGYEDGTFKPKASITRAEAAKMIYNFMYVKGLLDDEIVVVLPEETEEPAAGTETEEEATAETTVEEATTEEATEATADDATTEETDEEIDEEIDEETAEDVTSEEATDDAVEEGTTEETADDAAEETAEEVTEDAAGETAEAEASEENTTEEEAAEETVA